MRNGSTMNDRRMRTIRNTGKNDLRVLHDPGRRQLDHVSLRRRPLLRAAARRRRVSTAASNAQIRPVANTSSTMRVGKSNLTAHLPERSSARKTSCGVLTCPICFIRYRRFLMVISRSDLELHRVVRMRPLSRPGLAVAKPDASIHEDRHPLISWLDDEEIAKMQHRASTQKGRRKDALVQPISRASERPREQQWYQKRRLRQPVTQHP